MTKIKLEVDSSENLSKVEVHLIDNKGTVEVQSVDVDKPPTESTPKGTEELFPKETHKGFDANMMDIANS